MNIKILITFVSLLSIISSLNAGSKEKVQSDSSSKKLYITIPFQFLPTYRLINDTELSCTEGEGSFEVPVDEVAIVLIDTWNSFESDKNAEMQNFFSRLDKFLKLCRENNVTVIHAPNHPVVDKYPQYHEIKSEVEEFMEGYPRIDTTVPPYLSWPVKNEYKTKIDGLRSEGRTAEYHLNPRSTRDISKYFLPLSNEYVVSSYDEYRYVLWKEKIKVILYTGGSLNECMLHRDTGINLLAGTDSGRTNFTLVVLEDCVFTLSCSKDNYLLTKQVMLDYYKQKIAVVSASDRLRFNEK
jgi:hypothetical protein